jgi:MFS family permease
VLFFGTFLNKFGFFVVPFLTLYLTQRGYSIVQAGVALSCYGAGNLAASLIGGYLADRIGRRPTIVLSMFSGAAAMVLLSQARTLSAIDLLAVLNGLTNELYRPAGSALLADVVPAEHRATAFAGLRAAFNAGYVFGPAVAGFLATKGYLWLFLGDASTSVLYGLVAVIALPETRPVKAAPARWTEFGRALAADPAFRRLLAAVFVIAILFYQQAATFSLYLQRIGFGPTVFGMLLSLNATIVVLCEMPLTMVTRRYPIRKVLALGFVVCGVAFALNGLARTVPELVGCMLLFVAGEMVCIPLCSSHVANLAPVELRGRYMGLYSLTWSLATIAGPALGIAALAAGGAALWLLSAGLGLGAAALVLRNPRAP